MTPSKSEQRTGLGRQAERAAREIGKLAFVLHA